MALKYGESIWQTEFPGFYAAGSQATRLLDRRMGAVSERASSVALFTRPLKREDFHNTLNVVPEAFI
jgi:hypothetical protein